MVAQLADLKPGVKVKVNPERPRKGTFEVRLDDGTVVKSLVAMPRPFKKLRALDLEQLAQNIAAKVQ